MLRKVLMFVVTLSVCFMTAANAAPKTDTHARASAPYQPVNTFWPTFEFTPPSWPTADSMADVKQQIQAFEKRAPSSLSESEEMKRFRQKFFAIQSADQLATELVQYCGDDPQGEKKKKFDALQRAPDLQYVVAQLCLIYPFRGIVQKLVVLVHRNRVARALAISALTKISGATQITLPTNQWRAGFAYVTEPDPTANSNDGDMTWMINFQTYLVKYVLPEMNTAVLRLADLGARTTSPFSFDKTLYYTPDSFNDQLLTQNNFQLRPIGPAEIASVIASIEAAMHNLLVFAAYNRNDYLNAKDKMYAALVAAGIKDAFVSGLFMDEINDKVRTHLLKSQFPQYLTLNGTVDAAHPKAGWYGKKMMKQAFDVLRKLQTHVAAAWTATQQNAVPYSLSIVKPLLSSPWSSVAQFDVDLFAKMINGPTGIQSVVTSETVIVDLPKFYDNPPSDLKELLPVAFHDESDAPPQKPVRTLYGKKFNNYLYNSAKGWDTSKYTPWLQLGSTPDVGAAVRIISQSWAGLPLAIPFAKVIE